VNTDTELLRKLVELAEKATPGPWQTEFNEKHGLSEYDVFSKTPNYQFVACHPSRVSNPIAHNMEFIAAARNAMPALSRLLEAGVPEGWQPIETAPKDGTQILIASGRWINKASWDDNAQFGNNEGIKPGWVIHDCEDYFYSVATDSATHWMPLPHPPSEGKR